MSYGDPYRVQPVKPSSTAIITYPNRAWQRCPVCNGRGEVAPGFYGPLQGRTMKCKCCGGKGALR